MTTRLVTLGGLRGTHDGVLLGWLSSQTQRSALLLYLAIERTATRDSLQAVFWPECDSETAAHRLSQTVYALRRALGDACIATKGRELVIGSDVSIDAVTLEAATGAGRFAEASGLYGGPFLVGVHLVEATAFEQWIDLRRGRYTRLFRKASRALTAEREQTGDIDGAIAAARAWLAPDSTDDEAQHRLIELLARVGDRSGALQQYAGYVRLLEQEELQPLDETRALIASIERSTSSQLLRPGSVASSLVSEPPAPSAIAMHESPRPRSRMAKLRPAALSVVVAVVAWLAWPSGDDSPPVPPRLAVLPLHAADGGEELPALAMGLSVELHGALSEVLGLDVLSMNAVLSFRDARLTMDSLGRLLSADLFIGGSVNRVGNQLMVAVEAFDARTADVLATRRANASVGSEVELIETMVADASMMLRELLGDRTRLTRWRAGTRNAEAFMAIGRAYADVSDADRLIAASDPAGAYERLRAAETSLLTAADADEAWTEPLIELARLSRKTAFLLYGTSGPAGADSIRAVIGRGVERAIEAMQRDSESFRALEARGELYYTEWLLFAREDSVLRRRAEADLDSARLGDTTLARAPYVRAAMHFMRGENQRARVLLDHAFERDAYLDGGRELLTRLFIYNFEDGADRDARKWCLAFERAYRAERFASSCRLQLLAWDTTERADIDTAWHHARRGTDATPPMLRVAQGGQLSMLVASVLARAGLADSARRVVTRVREAARTDARATAEPFASTLDQLEAAVRVQLHEPAAASALLQRYLSVNPQTADAMSQSRRFRGLPPQR